MKTGNASILVRRSLCCGGLLTSWVLATAVAAAPGDVRWEDVVDGSLHSSDLAEAVDARDGRVFVAGEIQSSAPGALTVRTYAASSGKLLWSARPETDSGDEAHGVHAFAKVVVVCGLLIELDGRAVFGVVAYDPATGEEMWRDTSTDGDAHACNGQQGKLYVVGFDFGADTGPDVLVRAYDASSGVMLWQDRFDGGGNVADEANAVAIRDDQVYVTGVVQSTPGNADLFVRRYDGATGALRWHQSFADSQRDEGTAIAVANDRVFVGGFASQLDGADGSAVLALRADTGARLWADFHEGELVNAIAVRAGHVVAASGPQGEEVSAVVRAYDARSGRLEWARSEGAGGAALTLDIDDVYAYWGAVLRTSATGNRLFVQAVDIATGQTVWEDARNDARPFGLVVDDRRLFVVGSTQSADMPGDFLVRALSAR